MQFRVGTFFKEYSADLVYRADTLTVLLLYQVLWVLHKVKRLLFPKQLDLAKLPARRSKIRPQMLIQSAGYVSQKSLDRLVCWMDVDMFSVLSAYATGERKVLKSEVVQVMYDGVLFAGVIAI